MRGKNFPELLLTYSLRQKGANMDVNPNVTIIGGADGPTSICLAGRLGGPDILLIGCVAMAVIIGVVVFVKKQKKK